MKGTYSTTIRVGLITVAAVVANVLTWMLIGTVNTPESAFEPQLASWALIQVVAFVSIWRLVHVASRERSDAFIVAIQEDRKLFWSIWAFLVALFGAVDWLTEALNLVEVAPYVSLLVGSIDISIGGYVGLAGWWYARVGHVER